MKKGLAIAAVALMALPAAALAQGLIGQCSDCHTMHNSEQGQPVALQGSSATPTGTANQNLLKMDCIACHASGTSGTAVRVLDNGSKVPQVLHSDFANDLAGGNFKHLADGGDRKGHNITDLFAADADNLYAAPGDYRTHDFGPGAGTTGFTCAGAVGCHGTRAQMIAGVTDPNNTINPAVGNTDGSDGTDFWQVTQKRQGIAAVSGAHHNNYDGVKDPLQNTAVQHDGAKIAASYRFIQGLKGAGNLTDRWTNKDASSHNEYFGNTTALGASCSTCHIEGDPSVGGSARMTYNSTLALPNQSMSGFCITCHGKFHSVGASSVGGNNGTGGAFLRHPSDYVIKESGEYAAYDVYSVTAPVARPDLAAIADGSAVDGGNDMVLCLSCHQAHATPNDGMLRLDYSAIVAGGGATGEGCLACHTTKGVNKQTP
jgi:predicted CXXCH cytochrome family protein